MFLIILIVILLILLVNPFTRFCLFHPITAIKLGYYDLSDYIRHKRYNECKAYGKITMFCASGAKSFGSGKTLSMVRYVTSVFNKYNNLPVWDDEKQEFVAQHIIVISNVELKSIPYIKFIGREQFVNIDSIPHSEHDILLFVIDEAGMEFNSRQYKDNLPTDFLVRLLQVRHNKCGLVLSSQRFLFCDKILRQTCSIVTNCSMRWRVVRLQEFDAYALENFPNPEMLQPISTKYYFASNALFNSYDTTYNVQALKRQLADNDLLDTTEILSRIGEYNAPQLAQNKIKQRYKKGRK